jgi:hypothetical protein
VLAIAGGAGAVAGDPRRLAIGLDRLELGEQRDPLLLDAPLLIGDRRQQAARRSCRRRRG